MSITAIVADLVARGRLIERLSPWLEVDDAARSMFVTPEIDALARRPFADALSGSVCQFLEAFCESNYITVSQNPFSKPSDVMLARVHPVEAEFWSLRVTDPEETAGIRILGACNKDAFVGLTWEYRENISDFGSEVGNAQVVWRDYFGAIHPHSGGRLDDYLTNYEEFK